MRRKIHDQYPLLLTAPNLFEQQVLVIWLTLNFPKFNSIELLQLYPKEGTYKNKLQDSIEEMIKALKKVHTKRITIRCKPPLYKN